MLIISGPAPVITLNQAASAKPLSLQKTGYLYIYTSNESENTDLFFDNLQVTHTRGPILEETHYYPFGLTMAGISSKAMTFGNPENKKKFNDGSELADKEFRDGGGLEIYETRYRFLDAQIGRFWQADPLSQLSFEYSPFVYGNNNPILLNDPLGLLSDSTKPIILPTVVVTAKNKKPVVQVLIWSKMTKAETNGQIDVGHTAIRIGNIFYGYYPTNGWVGSPGIMRRDSLPQFNTKYIDQEITYYQLNLTSEQIMKLREVLEDIKADPGNYSLLDQQCTSIAIKALVKAGVKIRGYDSFTGYEVTLKSGVTKTPKGFQKDLELPANKGLVIRIIKYIVGR